MASSASSAASRQNTEMVRTDGKSSGNDKGIASKYADNYIQDGNAYRSVRYPEKIEFVDRKDRMMIFGKANEFTVRAMVETAKERGWESMDVRGRNPVFKSMAYVEGTVRGIQVTGHQPSQKDLAAIERRQTREEAKANPLVQAFVGAKTPKARETAISQYPQLKEAFAAQALAQAAVKSSGALPQAQQDLMDRVNDRISRALHQGLAMPQLEVRTQHQIQEVERD